MIDFETLAALIESRITHFPPLGATETTMHLWCKSTLPELHTVIDTLISAGRSKKFDEDRSTKRRLQNMATSIYDGAESLPEAAVLVRRLYAKPDDPELAENLRILLTKLEAELRQLGRELKEE